MAANLETMLDVHVHICGTGGGQAVALKELSVALLRKLTAL
jgi:hypothetical protein